MAGCTTSLRGQRGGVSPRAVQATRQLLSLRRRGRAKAGRHPGGAPGDRARGRGLAHPGIGQFDNGLLRRLRADSASGDGETYYCSPS